MLSQIHTGFHIEYPLFFTHILNKFGFFYSDFQKKSSYIDFHENPCSGIRVVSYGRTDISKLTDAFSNFAKRLNKIAFFRECIYGLWRSVKTGRASNVLPL